MGELHAKAIWILFIMSILFASTLALDADAQYSIVYNVTIPIPAYTMPHCAIALKDYLLLVAGYTGRPPRAYAALIDLRHGSVTPLPVPGLEGSTRSEVLGCETTSLGPVLYGYVQYANGTPVAYIWIYRNGALTPVKLKHVIVIPMYMLIKAPLSYIVGFIGTCNKGVLGTAYVLQGNLTDILSGNYKVNIYLPAWKTVNGSIYQVLGGRAYHCVYFTGAYMLPTGDIEIIGYAINKTGSTGLVVKLDGLFQVVENVTLQPFLPVSYTLAGEKGVAIGYLAGSVSVAIYCPDGSIHYARVRYNKSPGMMYFDDISCQENLCVVGGYVQAGQARQGLIMFLGLARRDVAFAKTYIWDKAAEVPAVYLSPSGLVYLIGVANDSLRVLTLRLTPSASKGAVSQALQTGNISGVERGGVPILVPLAVILASGALVAAILLHISRRRSRR